MDQTGLLCLDQTQGTALQLSSAGAVPFGCLAKNDSNSYAIGYSCNGSDANTTKAPAGGPLNQNQIQGAACQQDQVGNLTTSSDGSTLMCSQANEARSLQWTKVTPVSGTHELGDKCDGKQDDQVGIAASGHAVVCAPSHGAGTWAWRSPE
ncbi:hypothetical protein [Nocardia sp. NBC_01327]|uniref:hypothetical protein n=1 Tax=Nocardia sp. NBC_01327 TaxID=2903593 RepID=UPI002E128EE7|nr:hypothetical protein OG326_22200 [Nocardia sp. NBC_01327]